MDKEFLINYKAKEISEQNTLERKFIDSPDTAVKEYIYSRCPALSKPLGVAVNGESIWPQIPLYGTLIVPLVPITEKFFGECHGFDIFDIEPLVDFARGTGKITFTLGDDPEEYAGLDFLDPIFTELKPRLDYFARKFSQMANVDQYRAGLVEFDTLAGINFYNYLDSINAHFSEVLGPNSNPSSVYKFLGDVFASLGVLGFTHLKESVADAIVEDPRAAFGLLNLFGVIIIDPTTDPLHPIRNISQEKFDRYKVDLAKYDSTHEMESRIPQRPYSCEIGKFLMKKLQPYPESFDACRKMCDDYKHQDLQNALNALQEAVIDRDYSTIRERNMLLSEKLDNVWADADKFGSTINKARNAITISLAVVGAVASGPIGPIGGGLLASIGYNVADKILETKTDSISKSVAKLITPNYLVNVFKFKKKYKDRIQTRV